MDLKKNLAANLEEVAEKVRHSLRFSRILKIFSLKTFIQVEMTHIRT